MDKHYLTQTKNRNDDQLIIEIVFVYHLYLQIIKRNFLDKTVFSETGFAVALKLRHIGGEPDGLSQIKARQRLLSSH